MNALNFRSCIAVVFSFAALMTISGTTKGSSGQAPQTQSAHPYPRAGVEMLFIGSKEGVDFGPYLKKIYASVRRNFFSDLPYSFTKGEKGTVIVRFRIQRDGTLSEKSLGIVSSSGQKDMDEAVTRVIHDTAPFDRLPEEYPKSEIEMQFSFYYNTAPEAQPKRP